MLSTSMNFRREHIETGCLKFRTAFNLSQLITYRVSRAVARTLIGGVYIHIFMFCPTSFFSNQIQIDQFEKKYVGQNMNI